MDTVNIHKLILQLIAAALLLSGCDGNTIGGGQDTETETETETNTDADTDSDSESASDTDTESSTESDTDTGSQWVDVNFSVLTYNVGNPDAADPLYPLRLQSQDYEDYISGQIQTMSPDVVVLQEVLSGKTCEAFTETDPDKTCFEWDTRPRPARRLMGPDYSIVCDQREQVECIGIHVDFGTIEGLGAGDYDDQGAVTPELPLDPCIWADGECTDSLCDAESTVSAVSVITDGGPLKVVHMHPMAQVSATISGDLCRAYQLLQVFAGGVIGSEDSLVGNHDRTVIAGDWNLGLEVYWARTMFSGDDAATVWDNNVNCPTCYYYDIDPRDAGFTRYSTTSVAPTYLDNLGLPIAIDHVVVSEGITGDCTLFDNGGQPSTDPIDAAYPGLGTLGLDERIDHYGILCNLVMEASNN